MIRNYAFLVGLFSLHSLSRHVDKEESLKLIKYEKFIDFCDIVFLFDTDCGYKINLEILYHLSQLKKNIEIATGNNETEKGTRESRVSPLARI